MDTTYNYIVLPSSGMSAAPDPGGGVYPAADAWDGIPELLFTTGTKIILVWAHNAQIVIRFNFQLLGDDNWGDDIVLYDALQAEPFYLSAQRCQVINKVPGSTALYQVMGQW